jgi:hypothetical protein
MPDLTDFDLRDPMPPVPGERERALVATRARQLGRRRRLAQGAGALALVAAVSVSVAALTAGGVSDPGSGRIETASSPDTSDAPATTAAPVTTVAPTLPPAPAPDTAPPASEAPAPAASEAPTAPVAPSTFTVSGTISNFPAGHQVTVLLRHLGGTFTTSADGAGSYTFSGIPAGTYDVIGQHVDPSGTATHAEVLGTITISGESVVSTLAFA